MKKVFASFSLETCSAGINPQVRGEHKLYDKLVIVGDFFIDKLTAVGTDMARFTVKTPTGERKRVTTLAAAHKAVEAWALEQAAKIPSLKSTDSALVTWRVKNYAHG